jgi:stearoyl-CoA desaturase (delta-9 desaturase)
MNTGLQQKRGYSFFNLFRTFGFHAACLWAFFIEWNLACVILALLSFYIRMFCITGGYHRYFAHHSYKTSRVFQFLMALVATAAGQRGPLTWTTSHRAHHVHSDREGDPHSPQVSSFF